MSTKKFKTNLLSLIKILKTPEELMRFLISKSAFTEEFIKLVTESEQLNKYGGIDEKYHFDLSEIKQKLQYEIKYNHKKNKIRVDITKNDIFSYNDTEEELFTRMDKYIRNQEFEKAAVLHKYFQKLELQYCYIR